MRVFLVEFACNMADFHTCNTREMLQCPWPALYSQNNMVLRYILILAKTRKSSLESYGRAIIRDN